MHVHKNLNIDKRIQINIKIRCALFKTKIKGSKPPARKADSSSLYCIIPALNPNDNISRSISLKSSIMHDEHRLHMPQIESDIQLIFVASPNADFESPILPFILTVWRFGASF